MTNAGLLDLVAHGIQDIYLIGNPQITFFKTVYKRHTNFSMEAFRLSYNQKPVFGGLTKFKIDVYADLLHTMIMEVDLPLLTAQTTYPTGGDPNDYADATGNISWVNNTGHAIVDYYDLKIGSNLIDRQYSEWMEIWTELTQSESKKRGLDLMLNRNPSLIVNPGPLTVYIPLQFWFCRNIGLALPLVALQYHEVDLEVQFNTLDKLYTFGDNDYYTVTLATSGSNIINVIKPYPNQTQPMGTATLGKIMVFPDGSQYYIDPTVAITGSGEVGDPYIVTLSQNLSTSYPNPTSVYVKPNGILDTSTSPQISEVRLYADYIFLDTIEQKEFAKANHRYLIEQLQYSGEESIPANTATKRFPINFNLPVKELYWITQLDTVYLTNDLFNYSNTVDPVLVPGNNMTSGLIYINGIERFSIRTGDYFRIIQPYQKHTRCPNNFVYSYSFAVSPEEHQPSGCSNFSKLNTKELFMNLQSGLPSTTLRVYGVNYNILRINSGMGGLAFSN